MSTELVPRVASQVVRQHLDEHLDALVGKSILIAKANGYAPFTTTIRSAWVEAIESISDSLITYLEQTPNRPIGPIATHDYEQDPRFTRMRQIAQRHRSVGITLQLYLGLLKHFQHLYTAELDTISDRLGPWGMPLIRNFFDEMELSVCSGWKDKEDHQRLGELQEQARRATMEKDRYLAVFESLRSPAFLLDHDHSLVHANQASASLFLSRDAQAGDVKFSRNVRPRLASLLPVLTEVLGALCMSDELIWLDTLDGKRCFEVRMRDLHDSVDNTALGHVLLMYDVTSLQRKTEEAQQSEQGMTRFMNTMSHEIRTPLHSVLGATELLRTADAESAATYLDVIDRAGKMLLLTLNNVLDYSKFEKERPTAQPVPIDVVRKLRDFGSITLVGSSLAQSRLKFEIDPSVPERVSLDWGMTQQVLNNLVSNAFKVDDGRGVVVTLRPVLNSLRFAVRDHGPGMPEDAAAALFHSFERISVRDTGSGGSGLGLAISHYLVEAMRGRIGYENRPDGTTVWFEVPIPHAAHKAKEQDLATHVAPPKSDPLKQCLLVDDDDITAMVTARQLETLGLSVQRAASVAEAKTLASQQTYDLFVVDYLLPDGEGPDFVASLSVEQRRNARFLALTATVDALKNAEAVFDHVLAKPAGQALFSEAIFGKSMRLQEFEPAAYGGDDRLSGLSPSTVSAMLQQFAHAWQEFRSLLREDRCAATSQNLAKTAHRLASNAALMGLPELETHLRRLEQSNGAPDISELISELDRDLSELSSWRTLCSRWGQV